MAEQRTVIPEQRGGPDKTVVPARLHYVNLKACKFEEMKTALPQGGENDHEQYDL